VAKGNLGNLLQHYVGLRAARRLAERSAAFEYFDLFAMAPWEPLERAEAAFVDLLDSFPGRSNDGVAAAFCSAWSTRYGAAIPREVRQREYPNSIALLLEASVPIARATLCEIDDQRRRLLAEYMDQRGRDVPCSVHVDWQSAEFEQPKGPSLVMLDPYQVHVTRTEKTAPFGYISVDDLRAILFGRKLAMRERAREGEAAAAVATVFSFSESDPDSTDRAVRRELEKYGWNVRNVRARGVHARDKRKPCWHQGWWCASHPSVAAPEALQGDWDAWAKVT
jgi:hypothetical protein